MFWRGRKCCCPNSLRRLLCSYLSGDSGSTSLHTFLGTECDNNDKTYTRFVIIKTWIFSKSFANFAQSEFQCRLHIIRKRNLLSEREMEIISEIVRSGDAIAAIVDSEEGDLFLFDICFC